MKLPYTPPGIGWLLAIVSLIIGILIALGDLAVTEKVIGLVVILLSAAILL